MTYEPQQINGKLKNVIKDDTALMVVKPKFYIKSDGTAWASHYIQMQVSLRLAYLHNLIWLDAQHRPGQYCIC